MSPNYVLDKSFAVSESAGIAAHHAVVRDPDNPAACRLPGRAGAPHVLGITTHSQPREGRQITVRRLGIAEAVAAGPIQAGEPVRVADETGRIAAVPLPRFTIGTTGANNAIVFEWLPRGNFSAGVRITTTPQDGTEPFSWQFAEGGIQLFPASTEDAITQTAASLIEAVNNDPVLSTFLRAGGGTGSSGAGVVPAATASCVNLTEQLNPFGIAEGTAVEAGDRIPVLLTP